MAALPSSRWLKSTEWLAGELGKPEVAVIDGSYYLPTQNRDARAEYTAAHVAVPSKPVRAKALYNSQNYPPPELHPTVTGASSGFFSLDSPFLRGITERSACRVKGLTLAPRADVYVFAAGTRAASFRSIH